MSREFCEKDKIVTEVIPVVHPTNRDDWMIDVGAWSVWRTLFG